MGHPLASENYNSSAEFMAALEAIREGYQSANPQTFYEAIAEAKRIWAEFDEKGNTNANN